jgi:hypothetical protein
MLFSRAPMSTGFTDGRFRYLSFMNRGAVSQVSASDVGALRSDKSTCGTSWKTYPSLDSAGTLLGWRPPGFKGTAHCASSDAEPPLMVQ